MVKEKATKMTEMTNCNVVEGGVAVEVTSEVTSPVVVGIKRPRLPLEVKAGKIAQRNLLGRWREENGVGARGALDIQNSVSASSFLAQNIEQEKAVVLETLQNKKRAPYKARTFKGEPGTISAKIAGTPDGNGGVIGEVKFIGPDGEQMTGKVLVTVGKKDPSKLVFKSVE